MKVEPRNNSFDICPLKENKKFNKPFFVICFGSAVFNVNVFVAFGAGFLVVFLVDII